MLDINISVQDALCVTILYSHHHLENMLNLILACSVTETSNFYDKWSVPFLLSNTHTEKTIYLDYDCSTDLPTASK